VVRPKDWVIDAGVLHKAGERADPVQPEAYAFLNAVRVGRQSVFLDYGGRIIKEYQKPFRKSMLVRQWFSLMSGKLVRYESGDLVPAISAGLLAIPFHNDDLPYVGVASRTESRFLVSEDSDYTKPVRTFLKNRLSVDVLSARQARQWAG
jgi:hypothetical protein